VSHNVAEKKIFPALLESPERTAMQVAEAHDWLQKDNSSEIIAIMQKAMAENPDKVTAYRNGNKNLLGMFMGQVMRGTKGQADPKTANKLVRDLLEQE